MKKLLHRLVPRRGARSGQGLVEYGIMLLLVGVAVLVVLRIMQPTIVNTFERFTDRAPLAPPSLGPIGARFTPPPATATAIPTITNTPPPGATMTPTPIPSETPTTTFTPTPSNTPTETPTFTPTPSLTPPTDDPTATPPVAANGVIYQYYEITGLSNLPNFDDYVPEEMGIVDNFDISVRQQNDDFAFRFIGEIYIATPGTYTFYTTSDDGSKLYINDQEIVNNDGLHGDRTRSGAIALESGTHDIVVTMFQAGGGRSLDVEWRPPGASNEVGIPDSVLYPGELPPTPTPPPPPPTVDPQQFSGSDIGNVSEDGSHQVNGNEITVRGSGSDIWGKKDEFYYAYMPMSGDGTVIARITSFDVQDDWSKAGIMIRGALHEKSEHVFVTATGDNGIRLQYRDDWNDDSSDINGPGQEPVVWLRLDRVGDTFYAYTSYDGITWGDAFASVVVDMNNGVYVGLAVTSHDDGDIATAVFDSFGLEER